MANRASQLDSIPKDIQIRSEWQDSMAYLQKPIDNWPIKKDYEGKAWESVLLREELRAKYKDLHGYQIMRIIDGRLNLATWAWKTPAESAL